MPVSPLSPSWPFGPLWMCHVLLHFRPGQQVLTSDSSTIRLEQPKKAPCAAQNTSSLHHGSLETVWYSRGDTASEVCSSACYSLPWLWASSFRLPLWFIVPLHFWAPGKCLCPINFDLEVSTFPRRKINHSSWEDAPHTTSSLVFVPPLLPSTFFSLLLFSSPFSEREEGVINMPCKVWTSHTNSNNVILICPNIVLLSS